MTGLRLLVASTLAGLSLTGVAACGGSSGTSPASWAETVCGPFTTYGQSQVTAVTDLNDAASSASTDQAAAKVQKAAAALDAISAQIATLRGKLKDAGTPAVDDGAKVIKALDDALAEQAATATSVAKQVRALTGTGTPLATKIQALESTFTTGNQKVSDAVSQGFSGTKGGQKLETAMQSSSCAKKLQASQSGAPS